MPAAPETRTRTIRTEGKMTFQEFKSSRDGIFTDFLSRHRGQHSSEQNQGFRKRWDDLTKASWEKQKDNERTHNETLPQIRHSNRTQLHRCQEAVETDAGEAPERTQNLNAGGN